MKMSTEKYASNGILCAYHTQYSIGQELFSILAEETGKPDTYIIYYSLLRWILPLMVLGRLSRKTTILGYL